MLRFIDFKQYERKHRHQVSPYGTFLSFEYPYPLGFLACGQLWHRQPAFTDEPLQDFRAFAAYWAVWHFHLAGIRGYYHANIAQEGWLYILNFIVSIFPFIILMNWLYYKPIEIFSLPSSSTSQQGISTRSSPLIPTASVYKTIAVARLLHHYRAKRPPLLFQPDIGMIPIHSPKNTYIMTQEEYNQSFTHLLFYPHLTISIRNHCRHISQVCRIIFSIHLPI